MTKVEKAVYPILAFIAISYVSLRAYLNPFINDEAYTFLYFVWTNKFIPFDTLLWSANNHPLNSFLTWVCYKLFGMDEWVLRLPNILAFIIFTFYTFKFGSLFKNFIIRWSFWICILATPYLLELFSYSRGYGLSIAFFTAGIWHFLQASKKNDQLSDWHSWLFMTLAMFSNLNLVNSYFIWLLLFGFFSFDKSHWVKWLFNVLIRAVVLIPPIAMGLKLKAHGELYFGFDTSIRDSFHSVLEIIYGSISSLWDILVFVIIIGTILGIIASAIRSGKIKTAYFIIGTFLILNILATLFQFWFLDVSLPRERTMIHWYFLIVASLFFGLHFLHTYWSKAYLLSIPLLLMPIAQAHRYNLHSASLQDWALQQFSNKFYKDILKLQRADNQLLTIESTVLFNKHVYDYLNLKYNNQLNDLQHASNISNSLADIILVTDLNNQYPTEQYNLICRDIHNGTTLLKRTDSIKTRVLYHYQSLVPKTIENQPYVLAQIELDTLAEANLLFSISANISSPSTPHLLYTTIALKDSIGKVIADNHIEITPLKKDWTKPDTTKFSFTWYNIPTSATLAEVYIRNVRKADIELQYAESTIFKLD